MRPSLLYPRQKLAGDDWRSNWKAEQDQDAIDFTDNDIPTLSNFPLSPRLQTLLLARNRISSIQPNLATSLPNLRNIVLTSNNFAELADLDPLRSFARLTHLVLLENPVTRKEVSVFLSGEGREMGERGADKGKRITGIGSYGGARALDFWTIRR